MRPDPSSSWDASLLHVTPTPADRLDCSQNAKESIFSVVFTAQPQRLQSHHDNDILFDSLFKFLFK